VLNVLRKRRLADCTKKIGRNELFAVIDGLLSGKLARKEMEKIKRLIS